MFSLELSGTALKMLEKALISFRNLRKSILICGILTALFWGATENLGRLRPTTAGASKIKNPNPQS
jgi:hypothetical protein